MRLSTSLSLSLSGEAESERRQKLEIVSGWKDIANYLGKGIRTVQRYEREWGLPVRRPDGEATGAVIAIKAELDGWVTASPIREPFSSPPAFIEHAAILSEFRSHVRELRRLRQECAERRQELHEAVVLLREKRLSFAATLREPLNASLVNRGLANLLLDYMGQKVN